MTRTSKPARRGRSAGRGAAAHGRPVSPRADGDWIELFFWPGRHGHDAFSVMLEGPGSYWRCAAELRDGAQRLVVEHATAVAVGSQEVRQGLVVPNWPVLAAGGVDARLAAGFAVASAVLTALRCFRRAP